MAGTGSLRLSDNGVRGWNRLGPGASRYFIPSLPRTRDEWSMLVAILGTTISPYLFFWQASEEVEEEKAAGQNTLAKRRGATLEELGLRNIDVGVGAFFSNMVMFFIILTTAITLNRHGITHIETARQAAEALRPLLAGSCSPVYAGDCRRWIPCHPHTSGINLVRIRRNAWMASGPGQGTEKGASVLRASILVSTVVGVGMDFQDINPVKALYWTSVINGLLAPFLLAAILVIASDRKLMQGQPSSRLGWTIVVITTLAMFAAGVAMFVV